MSQSIFFSVGEPSGDQHTSRLIESLRLQRSDLRFRGFGGAMMETAGCQIDFDLTQLAVMGLVEVLPKLRDFHSIASRASRIFERDRPSAVVLVDFPGFNWHIAKRAKKHGIPVYYYLPPQLWAWAPWRIRKVRKSIDTVLSVLPFEHRWYSDQGIDVRYVGHPFFDAINEQVLDPQALDRFAHLKASGKRLVAVLPGSRRGEVTGNWPLQLESVRRLAKKHPDAHFLVACHRDPHGLFCKRQLTDDDGKLPIDFFVGKTSEICEAADCALMVSGSISLELMARKTPAVVLYRVGHVFHFLASRMLQVDSITLPNLIARETLFPETVSKGDPEPAIQFMVREMDQLLRDESHRRARIGQLEQLCDQYAQPGASQRAASAIVSLLDLNRVDSRLLTNQRNAA